ncbi:unnamed protein product [Prunus armeniaca]
MTIVENSVIYNTSKIHSHPAKRFRGLRYTGSAYSKERTLKGELGYTGYPDSAERGMRIRLTKCILNPAKIAAQVNFVLPRPARTCNKCNTRN